MAIDPSTGHEFAELPETTPEQVAEMVDDARRALDVEHDWRVPHTRARVLAQLAGLVEAQADALAELETRDTGRPLSQSRGGVTATVRELEHHAGAIVRLEGRTLPLGPPALAYTLREPWGICAQIISWDHPLRMAARCAAPALAAGNAVILKPSELASITPLRLAELAEAAGVPRGMIQVATGHGHTGAALVDHAGVDHVTFAGSPRTAAGVAEACGRRLAPSELHVRRTPVHLVFADADLDAAVRAIARGAARLLIEQPVYDEAIERLSAALAALTMGPGPEDHDLGPLISERHLRRALAMLDGGATVVTGGEHTRGLFMRPALVTGADPEIDGPVLVALAFGDEREALRVARGSVATIWTRDLVRAHRTAAGLGAGQVAINGSADEPSRDALYTRVKRVQVAL